VQLAEQLRKEELALTTETTNASDAFRSAGRSSRELFELALQRRADYGWLGTWLGAWVGLVIAAKLIQLSLSRRRIEYTPDRSGCVACGRCFWYCPVEQVRLGQIVDVSELVPEVKA
jgi:ferredoxin